jgi:hypothetical protein
LRTTLAIFMVSRSQENSEFFMTAMDEIFWLLGVVRTNVACDPATWASPREVTQRVPSNLQTLILSIPLWASWIPVCWLQMALINNDLPVEGNWEN